MRAWTASAIRSYYLDPEIVFLDAGHGEPGGVRLTAESAVAGIEKDAMICALHDEPTFSQLFMAHLLSCNVQIEADLVDQLFNSSEKRLARVLLLLAHFGKDAKIETVIPKINQEILAARVGTTQSRINYFMNKFRKLGFIEYNNGTLKVHPSLLNVIVHD